jgi:hypothetical protein
MDDPALERGRRGMSWEIWLCDPFGVRLRSLDQALAFEAARVINQVGGFSVRLAGDFDLRNVGRDYLVEFWRNGRWFNTGLLRRVRRVETAGVETVEISGPDVMHLLRRRIVAHYAGSASASKTDYIDDMMKDIVRENFSAPTDTARTWSLLSVAADVSDGPMVTRGFAWRNVHEVLIDLSLAAEQAGAAVYFYLAPIFGVSGVTWQFRTAATQPGIDRTGDDRLMFGREFGNLANPELDEDYSDEATWVYAGGQGEGAERVTQTAHSTGRAAASPWGRIEVFEDARNETHPNGVQARADGRLAEQQPRLRFSGDLLETPQCRYGIDWSWGDRVVVSYAGRQWNGLVKVASFGVDGSGEEQLSARIDADDVMDVEPGG